MCLDYVQYIQATPEKINKISLVSGVRNEFFIWVFNGKWFLFTNIMLCCHIRPKRGVFSIVSMWEVSMKNISVKFYCNFIGKDENKWKDRVTIRICELITCFRLLIYSRSETFSIHGHYYFVRRCLKLTMCWDYVQYLKRYAR